ncbi:MAG: hypothetical protein BWX70_03420 [Verrucomicrobia bacterium ADurb.Bin070]|nr:MAG: hypothetical protein BWX70_03420 [Verrucomicrobia bacterium ADurb.Bin070]
MPGGCVHGIRFAVRCVFGRRAAVEGLRLRARTRNRENARAVDGRVHDAVGDGHGADAVARPFRPLRIRRNPAVERAGTGFVRNVHGEHAVVRLGGEQQVARRAGRPHVEAARVERRIVCAADAFRTRRVRDVEDVEPVPHAAAVGGAAEAFHLLGHHAARHLAVLGVVSRGGVQIVALQPHTVAVPVKFHMVGLSDGRHVVRVEDGDIPRPPVA